MKEKLAVPWEEVKHYCSTSGTTGAPEPIPFTRNDFERGCINNLCRATWAMGLRPIDVAQNLSGFVCFSRVSEALGATALKEHAGRGNLDNQIMLAKTTGVTVLEHLPSLALQYFDRAKELGIDLNVRLVIGLGEPWAESYKKRVEEEYGVTFKSAYGLTEAGELSGECEYGGGMHISADTCILEVIDPETHQVLAPGQEGELVVTNFFRRAVPRIRFRTSDITKILPYEPCPCGRTHPKMAAVKGRLSYVINVRGRKLFPVDVEEVLGSISDLGHEYQIIRDRPGEQERLEVRVEHRPDVKRLDDLENRLKEEFNQKLGVPSEVELVPVGSIGRALFKAQRIVAT